MVVSKSKIDPDNFAWIDALASKYDMSHSQIIKEVLDYVRISGSWRLDATSHNLSYTDAALVLQQDAFISTVDENNVYNSEAILPIIRVR